MRKPVLFPIAMLLAAVAMGLVVPDVWAGPGSPPLIAAPVTLAWGPSANQNIAGYAIYYGPTNQPATNRVSAGTNLAVTLFDLKAYVGYRIYAVAYNGLGAESVPSNELLFTPVPVSAVKITRQADGAMSLQSKAAPGTRCTVLFTPTLQPATWQTLTQVTADQVGNVLALDASARQVPIRFYRVALGTQPLLGAMQINRQADGNMVLTGKAPPGASCRVLYAATPNATSWQTLKTVTADATGSAVVLDSTARLATRRFYRMVTP